MIKNFIIYIYSFFIIIFFPEKLFNIYIYILICNSTQVERVEVLFLREIIKRN